MAMSPDGSTIITGSPDETLRFWKIFPTELFSNNLNITNNNSNLSMDSIALR